MQHKRYCFLIPRFFIHHLQGEIGRLSGSDNVLEREAYALSAGLSLGLVALGMRLYLIILMKILALIICCSTVGRGDDALGFMDALVDRLFQYVGGQELHNV